MAVITKTIGTVSRDHATVTLWEAELDDGGVYSSGDDAVGEMYNDSVFNEAVTIDGGGTVGLNSVTLSVAAGERHDGTAGTGARNETANFYPFYQTVDSTIEWLECVNTKSNGGTTFRIGAVTATIRNVIGRCTNTGSAVSGGVRVESSTANYDLLNSLIYNCPKAGVAKKGAETAEILNSTFFNNGADGTYDGVELTTNTTVKNVISVDSTGDDFESAITPSSESHNISSDTTAGGTGSLTSIASVDLFVSTVSGSEDLHLKSGSDAIDAGTDLGTTPTGVNIDINGRDRDAEGDTWDIGAHEFVGAGIISSLHQVSVSFKADFSDSEQVAIDFLQDVEIASNQIPVSHLLDVGQANTVPVTFIEGISSESVIPVAFAQQLSITNILPISHLADSTITALNVVPISHTEGVGSPNIIPVSYRQDLSLLNVVPVSHKGELATAVGNVVPVSFTEAIQTLNQINASYLQGIQGLNVIPVTHGSDIEFSALEVIPVSHKQDLSLVNTVNVSNKQEIELFNQIAIAHTQGVNRTNDTPVSYIGGFGSTNEINVSHLQDIGALNTVTVESLSSLASSTNQTPISYTQGLNSLHIIPVSHLTDLGITNTVPVSYLGVFTDTTPVLVWDLETRGYAWVLDTRTSVWGINSRGGS